MDIREIGPEPVPQDRPPPADVERPKDPQGAEQPSEPPPLPSDTATILDLYA